MTMHSLLLSSVLFFFSAFSASEASSDEAGALCSVTCARLVPLGPNATKEEMERFEVSSNNGEKCITKCRELYAAGESVESLLSKVRNIPFDSIFQATAKPVGEPLDKIVADLVKRVQRLEALVLKGVFFPKATPKATTAKTPAKTEDSPIANNPAQPQINPILHDGPVGGGVGPVIMPISKK